MSQQVYYISFQYIESEIYVQLLIGQYSKIIYT